MWRSCLASRRVTVVKHVGQHGASRTGVRVTQAERRPNRGRNLNVFARRLRLLDDVPFFGTIELLDPANHADGDWVSTVSVSAVCEMVMVSTASPGDMGDLCPLTGRSGSSPPVHPGRERETQKERRDDPLSWAPRCSISRRLFGSWVLVEQRGHVEQPAAIADDMRKERSIVMKL